MGDRSRDKPFESAVLEALDSVAAPRVRDAVVREALTAQGLATVPSDPSEFSAFVSGPLRRALLAKVGDELGHAALSELERMAEAAIVTQRFGDAERRITDALVQLDSRQRCPSESLVAKPPHGESKSRRTAAGSERRRGPSRKVVSSIGIPSVAELSNRATAPGAPSVSHSSGTTAAVGNGHARRILVSTTDADLVRGLAACVDSEIDVLHTWGVANLVHLLEDTIARSIVVLDCAHPGAGPRAVAALAEDLPALADVLLLGGDTRLLTDLARISSKVERWRICLATIDFNEIAEYCGRII